MNRRRFAGISVVLALGIAGCLHGDDETEEAGTEADTPTGQSGANSGEYFGERPAAKEQSGGLNADTPEAAVKAFLTTEESRQAIRLLHSESLYDIELVNFDTGAEIRVLSTTVTHRNDAPFVEATLGGPNSLYDADAIGGIAADETAAVTAVVSFPTADDAKLTYSVLAASEGDSWRVIDIYDVVEGTVNLDGTLADARRSPERLVRAYFSSETNSQARVFLHSESLLELDDDEESVAAIDAVSIEMGRKNLDRDAVAATLSVTRRGYSDAAIGTIAAGQTAEVTVVITVPVEHRSMTVEATVLTATDAGDWSVVDVVDLQETPMTTTEPRSASGR